MQTDCGRPHQRHQAANQQASNRTENWNHSHVRAAQARTCSLPRSDPLATRDSACCCWDWTNACHQGEGGTGWQARTSPPNEAPGPVGAYTTTHNDTITLMPNLIHRISFTELKFECRTRVAEGTSAGRSTLRHNRTHAPTGPRRARTYMRI